jgi:multiple sugar transport system substrate-binding protein
MAVRSTRGRAAAAALGILALTGATAGCASAASDPASDESPSGTVTIGMVAGLTPQYEEVVAAFEEQHPDITIELQAMPDEIPDMTRSLQTSKLGGQLPDIVIAYADNVNQLAAAGVTADLTPLLEDSELQVDSFLPNYLDAYRPLDAPDEIHGLPVGADALILAYNGDVFEQAGVELPQDDWTWDDFDAAADALSKAGAGQYYGLANGPENALISDPIIKAMGGYVYDPETNTTGIGEPEAIAAWELMADEWLSGRAAPYTVNRNERPKFQDGRIAMIFTVRPAVPSVNAALDNWDVVSMPSIDGVRPVGGSSYALALTADATNAAGAWEFLQFMYANDGGMGIMEANGGIVPATVEGVESGTWQNLERPANQAAFGTAALEATMISQFPPAVQTVYDAAIAEAFQKVVLGGVSVEDAFTEAAAAVTAALENEK